MTQCRFDRESGAYLTPDGDPCRRDEYGDPTHHCTARRTCAQHVGPGELTCARCLGRTRADLKRITDLAPLMLDEAVESAGVESEAANLAGPAADVEAWTWRKVAARQGRAWHVSLVEDDDETHAYSVLARWEFMLREDYDQPRPIVGCRHEAPVAEVRTCREWHGAHCWSSAETPTSVVSAAGYLDRTLHRVAQDDGQDFGLLARELRRCRSHLESVMRDSRAPERGAPCPQCKDRGIFVRLVLEFGHWCNEDDCEQIHFLDDSGDIWRCPVKAEHWWNPSGYAEVLRERQESA